MSRTKKINKKIKNWIKQRKMKPYCLTGDKRTIPAFIDNSTSYENYDNIGDAKRERADIVTMKKTEKHRTRQQSKLKIKKELE